MAAPTFVDKVDKAALRRTIANGPSTLEMDTDLTTLPEGEGGFDGHNVIPMAKTGTGTSPKVAFWRKDTALGYELPPEQFARIADEWFVSMVPVIDDRKPMVCGVQRCETEILLPFGFDAGDLEPAERELVERQMLEGEWVEHAIACHTTRAIGYTHNKLPETRTMLLKRLGMA